MSRLSIAKVRALREPGRYPDGGTLYLCVAPGGSKSWVQRLTINGRRRDIGLGGWPLTSLAEVRAKAFENRRVARSGGDPIAARRRVDAITFREAAEKTIDGRRRRWRSDAQGVVWRRSLERYAYPVFGDLPVHQIQRQDVLRVLQPLWNEHPQAAKRLRQRIGLIFEWCEANGFMERNLAGKAISGALPRHPPRKKHHRALAYQGIPDMLRQVEVGRGSLNTKLCFLFLVLTGVRGHEARHARWEQIDLPSSVWKVPAEIMKMDVEHEVPLSAAVLEVLNQARALDDGSAGLVFPSRVKRGQPLSHSALRGLVKANGFSGQLSVHGCRASFRTWAAECTDESTEVLELCLAHTVGDPYIRTDQLEKRRRVMEQWGVFACGTRLRRPP